TIYVLIQAEDGIRDRNVTGVQTCALPIYEIDEVLLDGAQTPLVISGMPRVQSNLYIITDQFIRTLDEYIDYQFDEDRDNVWLTRSEERRVGKDWRGLGGAERGEKADAGRV